MEDQLSLEYEEFIHKQRFSKIHQPLPLLPRNEIALVKEICSFISKIESEAPIVVPVPEDDSMFYSVSQIKVVPFSLANAVEIPEEP